MLTRRTLALGSATVARCFSLPPAPWRPAAPSQYVWRAARYSSSVGGMEPTNGICQQTLKEGDQLLFAPAPDQGSVYPTAIQVPRPANAGHPFTVRVLYYNTAGKPRPLAAARVSDGKHTITTGANGYATVIASAGRYRITVTEKGYVRSAPVSVKVS